MNERAPTSNPHEPPLKVWETPLIVERRYRITQITLASEVGKEFGMHIKRMVPVYYLDGTSGTSRGAYHPGKDIVLVFTNTDEETLQHELTHVIEYHEEKTPELLDIYRRALDRITEGSFTNGFVSLNFRKNIHEFIADGRTKPALIEALKKEGLYDDFIKASAYLFSE